MSIPNTYPLGSFADTDKRLFDALTSLRDAPLNSPALQIKSGAKTIVQTGAASTVRVADKLFVVASTTDMPALVGTVLNAKFNVFSFFQKYDGTRRTAMGTAGATISDVVYPLPEQGEALIGSVLINPTGTGNFVGGTTELDDATVVPNAVYRNNVAPLLPMFNI